MSIEVISYIGVIGSGKNYWARKHVEAGFVNVDFKDALMEMCSDLVGYDVSKDYEWFKEHLVGLRKCAEPTKWDMDADALFRAEFPDMMTGRRLLQRLGTEVMRKRDPDYWTCEFSKRAIKVLGSGKNLVNADCRFFNEIDSIMEFQIGTTTLKKKFIFCDYRSDRYDPTSKHQSEKLAKTLLSMGLKDGQEIKLSHFEDVAVMWGDPWRPTGDFWGNGQK